MHDIEQPRWIYRFDNYKRGFLLLRQAIEIKEQRDLSQLEQEGVIQRFEYVWELAWKTLKDYLEYQGIILPSITPSATIKAGFAANIIKNGDDWMKMQVSRNKMAHAHTYNLKKFIETIDKIEQSYLGLFQDLYDDLLEAEIDFKESTQ